MSSHERFNKLDHKLCKFIRMVINWGRLLRGYTLINRQGNTVKLIRFKQVMSNTKRKKLYKLDDFGWMIKE